MGNCFTGPNKSTAEISPCDCIKAVGSASVSANPAAAAPVTAAVATTTVRLYGSPISMLTSYIRFALLYKAVPLRFVPSETTSETPTLQIGSETVSGTREKLLRFVDEKFPEPPLRMVKYNLEGFDETTPLIVRVTWLQHRSLIWHLHKMVRWAEDLSTRGGRKSVDPSVGTPTMELKKFGKSYSHLLDLMLEHAQMEERVLFPVLEMADRGNLYCILIHSAAGNRNLVLNIFFGLFLLQIVYMDFFIFCSHPK